MSSRLANPRRHPWARHAPWLITAPVLLAGAISGGIAVVGGHAEAKAAAIALGVVAAVTLPALRLAARLQQRLEPFNWALAALVISVGRNATATLGAFAVALSISPDRMWFWLSFLAGSLVVLIGETRFIISRLRSAGGSDLSSLGRATEPLSC